MGTTSSPVKPGSDLRDIFRRAYENRYTWEPGFGGYQGRCIWKQGDQQVEGRFQIGADLKAKVEGIEDEAILKAISSQLWEIAIHRVRRSFEQTHGANTFTAGETDSIGTEVISGGRSNFTDTFVPLGGNGRWVLEERVIETEAHGETPAGSQTFRFEDLQAL